jgi:hypothetical protein
MRAARVIFGQLITFFIGSTKISDGKNKRRAQHTVPAVWQGDNFQMRGGCKIPLSPFLLAWRIDVYWLGTLGVRK